MNTPKNLTGIELIDCAKANAKYGVEKAAQQCGYGQDIKLFQQTLQEACDEKGISIDADNISLLITDQQLIKKEGGVEIAPDTASSL
ncbi:hypothetical protein [Okeania sp. KiyG1]|uniref:hypothetical protein n=1 Tax=Okeania sp. KiyG1 TaxID=2720165 RepID=UPI0019222AC7|nr:hypothetical protein [Okeania sp. KiyG1]